MEKIFKFAPSNMVDASYRAPSFHVLARAGDHHSGSVSRTNFYGYATKQLWYTGASDSLPSESYTGHRVPNQVEIASMEMYGIL